MAGCMSVVMAPWFRVKKTVSLDSFMSSCLRMISHMIRILHVGEHEYFAAMHHHRISTTRS
jgi:hypothetical protein